MKNILLRLREREQSLTKTERSLAQFIRKNFDRASHMTIRELAQASFTSPSTILRLARQIGFVGFKEFREALQIESATLSYPQKASNPKTKISSLSSCELTRLIDQVTQQNIKSLSESLFLIDEKKVKQCVNLLDHADHILLFGIGSSFIVCRDFALKLLRLNRISLIQEDVHSQYVQAINSTSKDVALFVSYSGKTKEMIRCAQSVKQNKTPSILITRYTSSPLSELCDHMLYTASPEGALRAGALASRIAQLNLIDILFLALVSRHYDEALASFVKTQIRKSADPDYSPSRTGS